MADLQRDGGDPSDPSLDFFDYDEYYGEHHQERESNANPGTQGPSSSLSLGRMSRLEPCHEQVDSSEVAVISRPSAYAFVDSRLEPSGEPSQYPTTTGSEPLHQYGQPSRSDIPSAELRHIEDELEDVDLRLRRRELVRRREELLQNSATEQHTQTFSRPGFRDLGTAGDSSNQPSDHGIDPNETSQRIDLLVSTILGLT